MGKVKYVLLDCDNTLCQSERLAFEACTELTNEICKKHNVDETYTVDGLLSEFVGMNFRGMIGALQKKHNLDMSKDEVESFVSRELEEVTKKLSEKCVECPGVMQQLQWTADQGYPMAVVSTSAKPRVVASLKKTGLMKFFKDEHVYSAATTLDPPSSKPDPAIYLHACKELGVEPHECVTVEDSKSGATAAMRAEIPLVAYVGIYNIEDGEEKMKEMAKTLTDVTKAKTVMYDWKEWPEKLKEIES